MKYLVMIIALFMMSCGGNNSDSKTTTGQDKKTEVTDPEAAKGLELVSKSDCFTCHKLSETNIGPPYAAIAEKYKSITPQTMDSMVAQIQNGGYGRWGAVPMTPHPQISRPDAEAMVHYIMSIKKE